MCEKNKVDIMNFSPSMLEEFAISMGEKCFRGKQISQWLFEKNILDIDEMTNLSLELRERLKKSAFIGRLTTLKENRSHDGTLKLLFGLHDNHNIETVTIPENDRLTICVSTQVGCKMGCKFCVTGKGGFIRNLSHGEIIGQILTVNRRLPADQKITNIVLMGMGEPLDNYSNVTTALKTIISPHGMNFPAKRVSLSTAGIIPRIYDLANKDNINIKLAVSLNAADNETRSGIMPVNKKHPIDKLLEVCKEYSFRRGKSVMFEYVMLGGINDRIEDAKRLVLLLHGMKCRINLIPFNAYNGIPYSPPTSEAIGKFHSYLIHKGFIAFTRKSRGIDIQAACGQLKEEFSNDKTLLSNNK